MSKEILRIVPTIQSAALVGKALKLAKKKKKKSSDLVDLGVSTIVGTAFIKTESDLIEGL